MKCTRKTFDRPGGAGAIASREHERRGLVVTAARIAGLLDLETTADTELLHTMWHDAGDPAAGRIVLTTEQEQAYHRLVDRLTAISTLGDPLVRWAMGTRDHH